MSSLDTLLGRRGQQRMSREDARRIVQRAEAYMQVYGVCPQELFELCDVALRRLEERE